MTLSLSTLRHVDGAPRGATGSDLSTAIPQQREPGRGRGLARAGSVASALTFEDYADQSNVNAAEAVAEANVLAGAEAEEAVLDGTREERKERNNSIPGAFVTDYLEDVDANGSPPLPAAAAAAAAADTAYSAGVGDGVESNPPLRHTAPARPSSAGREMTMITAGSSTQAAAASAPPPATAAASVAAAPAVVATTRLVSGSDVPACDGAPTTRGGSAKGCGLGVDDDANGENIDPANDRGDRRRGGGYEGKREREREADDGAAEWWRDALWPKSRRPVTRRSLVGGGGGGTAGGVGTRSAVCILEGGERGREKVARTVCGGDGGAWRTAAPICGFSTESKQQNLEDFLKRRCGKRAESSAKIPIVCCVGEIVVVSQCVQYPIENTGATFSIVYSQTRRQTRRRNY